MNESLFSSASVEWATPWELFRQLDAEFRFNLDPCSTHENAKCADHFTKAEDGLLQDWGGKRVFCNPPYGRELPKWIRKAHDEVQKGALVVMLIPARTDTRAFHDYIYHQAEIRASFLLEGSPLESLLKTAYFPLFGAKGKSKTEAPKSKRRQGF